MFDQKKKKKKREKKRETETGTAEGGRTSSLVFFWRSLGIIVPSCMETAMILDGDDKKKKAYCIRYPHGGIPLDTFFSSMRRRRGGKIGRAHV